MTTTLARRTAAAGLSAAAAALLMGAGTPSAAAAPSAGTSDLAAVRAATAKYHDVATAEADGYVPVSDCEAAPGLGVMGIHYLNPALAGDAAIDPTRPEVLLYLPTEGGLKLVAVEYFVAAAAAPERPSVLGHPFDGPMAGHSPGMPEHYDLHLWIWRHNPTGVASPWNPALSCG
jgi:hypothetical protein